MRPVLCLAGVALCGVSGASPGLSAAEVDCGRVSVDQEVAIVDFGFEPKAASIPTDGVVRWTNRGGMVHTVTSGDPGDEDAGALFDSGSLRPGESFCLELTGSGTTDYFCRPHPSTMRDATLTVTP